MASIKIITSENANIYIDQELKCTSQAGKIIKFDLTPGIYILDVESTESSSKFSEDIEIDSMTNSILRRINFNIQPTSINDLILTGQIDSIEPNGIIVSNGYYGIIHNNSLLLPIIYDNVETFEEYYIAQKNGIKELVDKTGNVIIPSFDEIIHSDSNIIVLLDRKAIMMISRTSSNILWRYECEEEQVRTCPDFFPVKNSTNKYGYMNKSGELLLDFLYDAAQPLDPTINLAYAKRYNLSKYISKNGAMCSLNRYEEIIKALKASYRDDNRDYVLIKPSSSCEWIGDIERPDKDNLLLFRNIYISIFADGKWAYSNIDFSYDRMGKYISPLTSYYSKILHDSRFGFPVFFDNGMCIVVNLITPCKVPEDDKLYSYGKVGEEIFKYKSLDLIPLLGKKSIWYNDWSDYGTTKMIYFIKGYVFKDLNHKYGVLDIKGNIICNPIYDDVFSDSTNINRQNHDYRDKQELIVACNGIFGLLNECFEEVLRCEFNSIEKIENFLYAVKKRDEEDYHLFDVKNQQHSSYSIIIDETDFSIPIPKIEERAGIGVVGLGDYIFKSKNGVGVIDSDLNILLPFKFDEIVRRVYSTGCISCYSIYFTIKNHGLVGLTDSKGTILIPCQYQCIEDVFAHSIGSDSSLFFLVKKKVGKCEKQGIFSKLGKELISCIYDSIEFVYNDFDHIKAFIANNGFKKAVFNLDGKLLAKFDVFSRVSPVFTNDSIYWYSDELKSFILGDPNHQNLLGIVNIDGIRICPYKYKEITPVFCTKHFDWHDEHWLHSYIVVEQIQDKCKYGIISSLGKVIVPCIYDKIEIFNDDQDVKFKVHLIDYTIERENVIILDSLGNPSK